jgi:hypothetical protein
MPASQVTIIAGLMIAFRSRLSITLNVSDCLDRPPMRPRHDSKKRLMFKRKHGSEALTKAYVAMNHANRPERYQR